MIKNQEVAQQLLNMMNTALECVGIMSRYLYDGQFDAFQKLSADLMQLVLSIHRIAPSLKQEESGLNLPEASESVRVSLERVIGYAETDPGLALHKMEFELVPLIEDMRMMFYFWGICYPDPERMEQYYSKDMYEYNRNEYIEQAEADGCYKYDLSIVVIAYNKLAYTTLCVESVLKNLPENLTYEIVLFNHGSTDGTKEYFESLQPHKQFDIAANGGGSSAVLRILEGRFFVVISNDVVVMPNAIQNLYNCLKSDPSIAWAVPATSNVSNHQTLPLKYKDMDELYKVAALNNQYDPFRHEQRIRLCNPIDIKRGKSVFELQFSGYMFTKVKRAFPDDKFALLTRRNGCKMYLVKDAYCHHFGSVTLKTEITSNDLYTQGRREFKKCFGVDPWGIGHCHDAALFEKLPCNNCSHTDILAVNCGLGANPLKIKESIKEFAHNTDVALYSCSNEPEYFSDMISISNDTKIFTSWYPFNLENMPAKYDYIIIEKYPEDSPYAIELLSEFQQRLSLSGYLIVKISGKDFLNELKRALVSPQCVESHDYKTWMVLKNKGAQIC